VSRVTWDTPRVLQSFAYEAFTLYGAPFQALLLPINNPFIGVPQPPLTLRKEGLDFSLFARHYWGNLGDFFSSWYLDVSVPMVSLLPAYIFSGKISRYKT